MSDEMSRTAVTMLGEQIGFVHGTLEQTLNDVNAEVAHAPSGGLARSIGSYYAHILLSEDLAVQAVLQGQAPLFAAAFAGKTGFDEPAPADPAQWMKYASSAGSDVASSRDYAQAVYAATDAYLASLSDADLAEELDLSSFGFGNQKRSWVLSTFVLTNCAWHTGEIACLKGNHGLKGYPF